MFWIISAVLTVLAMAFIFPALLKRNVSEEDSSEQNIVIAKEQLADLELRYKNNEIEQESYQSSKDELERALFEDLKQSDVNESLSRAKEKTSKSIDTWIILLLVPVIAVPVYLNLGNLNFTKHLDSKKGVTAVAKPSMPLKADGTPDVEKLAQELRKEMDSNPTDPTGWYMLGRAYMMIQRYPDAAESFDKSLALRPDLVDAMLALADALSLNNDGLLIGRPRDLVKQALTIDPNNLTALWLSGMAASQASEYQEAIAQWQKVLSLLGDDKADEKTAVNGLIAEATSRLRSETIQQPSTQNTELDKKGIELKDASKSIELEITLSQQMKDKVSPEDSIFIYAKAMEGPPMPLAAARKQVKDLPIRLVLNDEMAMMPQLKLSSFDTVAVGARITKSGQAIAQDGDLFAEKSDISLGGKVTLEINRVYSK